MGPQDSVLQSTAGRELLRLQPWLVGDRQRGPGRGDGGGSAASTALTRLGSQGTSAAQADLELWGSRRAGAPPPRWVLQVQRPRAGTPRAQGPPGLLGPWAPLPAACPGPPGFSSPAPREEGGGAEGTTEERRSPEARRGAAEKPPAGGGAEGGAGEAGPAGPEGAGRQGRRAATSGLSCPLWAPRPQLLMRPLLHQPRLRGRGA